MPNENTVTAKVKPIITGLSKSGSFVHIFIDGIYNGKTNDLEHISGTANFAYKPFLNLSVGEHSVYAIAEDEYGRKSLPSKTLTFNIEEQFPAPTLFQPVINTKTNHLKPFVVGLAKNNAKVKVYIDHVLNGEFLPNSHESGTANFAYKPFSNLSVGKHFLYVTATDERGKESPWSNIVYFDVGGTGQITPEAVTEENKEPIVKGEELVPSEKEKDTDKSMTAEVEEKDLEEIEDFLKPNKEEGKELGGLINEEKERQGKLKLNLVIFIFFLLAVIVWIFWVNRELIKEKREENLKSEK